MEINVYPWNSITLRRCLNFGDSLLPFSWNIRYSFISAKLFITDLSTFCFALFCFCCLLLEYLLSVCWISVFKPSYLSSSLLAFIYLSFSSAFCQFFEDCFPHHQLCFWFVDVTSYYFNIFIGSAMIFFLLSVSFFNCQLPFHLILMSYHFIFWSL